LAVVSGQLLVLLPGVLPRADLFTRLIPPALKLRFPRLRLSRAGSGEHKLELL